MLLEYKNKNVLSIPVNNQASGTARIVPGINEFSNDLWKEFKDHPVVKGMVESGQLKEVTVQEAKKAGSRTKPKTLGKEDGELDLTKVEQTDAINLAERTFNLALLERWEMEETRAKVKTALKKQIKKINDKGAPAKKDAN